MNEKMNMSMEIKSEWIEAFKNVFDLCEIKKSEKVIILSESSSRRVNIDIAKIALGILSIDYALLEVKSKINEGPLKVSTGASNALNGRNFTIKMLLESDVIVDLTCEGLMHSEATGKILKSGTRIMNISNENPEILCRLAPKIDMKDKVKNSLEAFRSAKNMNIKSKCGTDLTVSVKDSPIVGVWGWTNRPGTLAHWPGGLVACFPGENTTNGTIVFSPGDINLTFKKYFESEVKCIVRNDFITEVQGKSLDAKLMRQYFESFNDANTYAVSHVGWGLNSEARYEAISMYEKHEINGTELRVIEGNFLFSTGANEFANRFTEGHFDLPMMDCLIELDGAAIVKDGKIFC